MNPYIPVAAALIGATVGSTLAFIFGSINSRASKVREERFSVFRVLVINRHHQFSKDPTEAISTIPALFWNKPDILTKYRHLCAMVPNGWNADFGKRYFELTAAIGKDLGYGAISEADFNLGFFLGPPQKSGTEIS